jgi:hypothetical protein
MAELALVAAIAALLIAELAWHRRIGGGEREEARRSETSIPGDGRGGRHIHVGMGMRLALRGLPPPTMTA